MTDALEPLFAQFPVWVRLTIVYALQERILTAQLPETRADAADVLTRIGYPESRDAAERVAAARAGAA